MTAERIVIGTRGSALALWQSRHVRDALQARIPGLEVELEVIKTTGDRVTDRPLAEVGGKRLFIKEIEEALLQRRVDLAVHSMKDVPTELPDGLGLVAICPRHDPRDALVLPDDGPTIAPDEPDPLARLARGCRVGTSSLRRRCQLLAARSDLRVELLRGNVDTRLRRLDEGRFDAIVLAAAGLERLGLQERITARLGSPWISAVGQGALGIEARLDDDRARELAAQLGDPDTTCCVEAERAVSACLEGSCQVPLAAHAQLRGGEIELAAMVGHPDGTPVHSGASRGAPARAVQLGEELGRKLLDAGGAEVLAQAEQWRWP